MRHALGLLALASLLTAGEPPSPHIGGTVASACDATPAPLANAKVTLRCPQSPEPLYVATTDAHGRFDIDATKAVEPNCTLEVAHDGHATRTFPIQEICSAVPQLAPGSPPPGPTPCAFAGVTAQLVKTGGTP